MVDEEVKCCEDCGTIKGKLLKRTEREQEYPGAHVWTWTFYLCSKCDKERGAYNPQPIQENTRGW